MNPTVIIKSIKNRHVMTDEEYNCILENIGKPLQLATTWFDRDGRLCDFAVYFGNTVIVLFASNVVEGEFGDGTKFQLS